MTRVLTRFTKEEAVAILREMAEDLANEQALAGVLMLRPTPNQKDDNRERRMSVAMYRRNLPTWLAAIDGLE